MIRTMLTAVPLLLLGACNTAGPEANEVPRFDGIAESETVRVLGTEPFWGAEIAGGTVRYSTPENPDGSDVAVTRFAGNSGLGFSGTLAGQRFDLMVTRGACSDGMSDRSYPFHATLMLGEEKREGCAWTDSQPSEGPANP